VGAPKENQFWKLRSTHGREKLFATPDLMWDAACEYFEWCEENPLIEIDFRGKDSDEVRIPKMRPYTLQGLCRYLDCNTVYFNQFEKALREKDDEMSKGFSQIVTRIREAVYEQKFSGAAAGFLNPKYHSQRPRTQRAHRSHRKRRYSAISFCGRVDASRDRY
jgi:hypothetical protein